MHHECQKKKSSEMLVYYPYRFMEKSFTLKLVKTNHIVK